MNESKKQAERERKKNWLNAHFQRNPEDTGWYAYKVFGAFFAPPRHWRIATGAVITVSRLARDTDLSCGIGIHAATVGWMLGEFSDLYHFKKGNGSAPVWMIEVLEADLDNIIVPLNSDGKFRTNAMRLVKEVGTVTLGGRLKGLDELYAAERAAGRS